MSTKHLSNFLRLVSSNLLSKIAWAVTLIILLSGLGNIGFGILVTIWSISALAFTLTDLGTSQALLREASRNPDIAKTQATRVLQLQLLLSVLIAILISLTLWYILNMPKLNPTQQVLVITTNVLAVGADRFQGLFTVFSQLAGNFKYYSVIRTIYFVAILIAFKLLLDAGAGLLECSLAYFILTFGTTLLMGILTWKPLHQLATQDKLDIPGWRKSLRMGLPFFGITALTLAYGRLEVSALGVWGYPEEAGVFHFDYQIILLFYSISGVFFTVIYPRLYRHLGNLKALEADYRDSVRWLSLLAWAATPPLIMSASGLLSIVGNSYTVSHAPVLQVLAIWLVCLPGAAALEFLMAVDKLRCRLYYESLGIGISAIGVLVAALYGSALYAACSAVIGYVVTIILAARAMRVQLYFQPWHISKEMLVLSKAAVPAIILTSLLSTNWWISSLSYLTAFGVFLVMTRHPTVDRIRAFGCHFLD